MQNIDTLTYLRLQLIAQQQEVMLLQLYQVYIVMEKLVHLKLQMQEQAMLLVQV